MDVSLPPSYRTSDLARIAKVHPNTVRLYERIGFIEPVPRRANGYRCYNQRHLTQLQACRCIYQYGWFGRELRTAGIAVIRALHDWDLALAQAKAREYMKMLEESLLRAKRTAKILLRWAERKPRRASALSMNRIAAAR